MAEVAEASLDETDDLPDVVQMSEVAFREFFSVWLLYISTGRKFLPEKGGLQDQSEICMQTILELDSLYGRILAQVRGDEEDDATTI